MDYLNGLTTTEYRWSKFTHFFPVKEAVGVYNSLNLAIVFLNQKTFAEMEGFNTRSRIEAGQLDTDQDILHQLVYRKMLVPVKEDEMPEYYKWKAVLKGLPVGVLYLLLTDACNFACSYCVIEGGLPECHQRLLMSKQTAKRSIDHFAGVLKRQGREHPDNSDYHFVAREPQIIIYGGEPLLNLSVLRFVLEYVSKLKQAGELPDAISVTMNTNGSLITSEVAQLLAIHDVVASVSLDGQKEQHDLARRYKSGGGTYNDVLRGFQNLQKAGAKASISCTLGAHNLQEAPELVDWFISELGIKGFGFNMLIDSEVMKVKDPRDYAEKASRILLECFKKAREAGVYEDRVMRKVRSFVEGRIYLNDCAGCGQQIVIAPDGQVGTCQAYLGSRQYFVDFDDKFDPIEHPIWQEWRTRSPLNMPECVECPALGICGGGCPHDAHMRGESIWSLDEAFCVHAKMTLEYLVNDLWSKMTVS